MKLHWSSKVEEEPCSKAPHLAIRVSRAPGVGGTLLEFTCVLEHMRMCERKTRFRKGLVYSRASFCSQKSCHCDGFLSLVSDYKAATLHKQLLVK